MLCALALGALALAAAPAPAFGFEVGKEAVGEAVVAEAVAVVVEGPHPGPVNEPGHSGGQTTESDALHELPAPRPGGARTEVKALV